MGFLFDSLSNNKGHREKISVVTSIFSFLTSFSKDSSHRVIQTQDWLVLVLLLANSFDIDKTKNLLLYLVWERVNIMLHVYSKGHSENNSVEYWFGALLAIQICVDWLFVNWTIIQIDRILGRRSFQSFVLPLKSSTFKHNGKGNGLLTLYHTIPTFNDPKEADFRKHSGKWRKCW